MATVESHDAVVLGSGEAGKSIAWHLGSTGQRVVVVEQRYVGGSCPNIACLPSKNFIHSASIAHIVATSEALGTRVTGRMSRGEIQARKRTMAEDLVQSHLTRFATTGCELVMGRGCFIAERVIEVARVREAARCSHWVRAGGGPVTDVVTSVAKRYEVGHLQRTALERAPSQVRHSISIRADRT